MSPGAPFLLCQCRRHAVCACAPSAACCLVRLTSCNLPVLQFYARGMFASPVITRFRYESGIVGKAKFQVVGAFAAVVSALDYPLRWMSGGEQWCCLPMPPSQLPVLLSGVHPIHSASSQSGMSQSIHCRAAGIPPQTCQILPSQLQCRAGCQAMGSVSRNRRFEQRPHPEMNNSASHRGTVS